MKVIAAILMLTLFTSAAAVVPDEASLRKIVAAHRANYAYRFSSWSSAEQADSFIVTFCFFFDVGADGTYSAHQSGMPVPSKVEIESVISRRGKTRTSTKTLSGREADDILCQLGYSGFFAQDSDDALRDTFDGHGLVAERLFKDLYRTRTRKYEEHLSCEWLYNYLQQYAKKG